MNFVAKSFVFLLLLLFDSVENSKIFGGHVSSNKFTRHVVSIRTRSMNPKMDGRNHFCGGTIIGWKTVLTAAHCVVNDAFREPFRAHDLEFIVGAPNRYKRNEEAVIHYVKEIIIHPRYRYGRTHDDIAMLIPEKEIEWSKNVEVAQLLSEGASTGDNCTVVGWGRLYEEGPLPAEAIQTNVLLWDIEDCRKEVSNLEVGLICASGDKNSDGDACMGDSGGPLFCQEKLAGIIVFGVECDVPGGPGGPGFYIDIAYYADWIGSDNPLVLHMRSGARVLENFPILILVSVLIMLII